MSHFALTTIWAILFSLYAHAGATLNTQCTKNAASGVVEGININTPYTIASVTKVFTSHWALLNLGPNFRFSTLVHITPLSQSLVDVHLEGSAFPYFDKDMLQFFVGELNRLGIRNINNLTYDEHFFYATDVRYDPMLAHGDGEQTVESVMTDLRQDVTKINVSLAALNNKALKIENLKLPQTLFLKVNDIHFVAKKAFQKFATTVSFTLPSSELKRSLKEMNRNSNNFAANKFFELIAARQNYMDFIMSRLITVRADEVALHNGSGYPIVSGENKTYNAASCTATVEMMADLRNYLLQNGLALQDILPVSGKDTPEDGLSTVTQIYGNALNAGAFLGKTGSVLTTVALAGLVITENENLFFQTSFNLENSTEDRAIAYARIKDWLQNVLIKDKKKAELVSYQPKGYLPFDSKSRLVKIENIKILN